MFTLDRHTAPDVVLSEALHLIADDTAAALAYLELFGADGSNSPSYRHAHPDADDACGAISRSIIRHVISERRTVETPCAVADARFGGAESVRRNEIYAAMCAPIMEPDGRLVGVAYLQAGVGAPAFGDLARERLVALTQALAHVANRLRWPREKLTYHRMMDDYAASLADEAHRRNDTNATAAARDLGIDRKTFYRFRYRKP
ncbi:MAG: GAF domain-containing protein [Kofleriaceae bacterium]|nr:GAF domain-containing protein [Kofleriaceae bacterium]